LLSRDDLELGLDRFRPEVELVRGVRVVARGGVRVQRVVGVDFLASLACCERFRVGPASIAEAIWEVPVERDVFARWLSGRLACDGPWGRRVRVGGGSKIEVGVLVVER
jgi:hypothetical protein